MKLIYVDDIRKWKYNTTSTNVVAVLGEALCAGASARNGDHQDQLSKLRKQSKSSVSFDIMPKTATYNQCYLVQAAKRYILRTSMERIKYGPCWSQALVQTDLHVEEVVACWWSLNKEFEFRSWHCGRQGETSRDWTGAPEGLEGGLRGLRPFKLASRGLRRLQGLERGFKGKGASMGGLKRSASCPAPPPPTKRSFKSSWYAFISFHSSVSLCFTFSPFHWPHGRAIASFWIVPILWVLMPLRLTHLRAPGWGESWFPHSVVLLRSLTEFVYCGFRILFRLFLVSPPYRSLERNVIPSVSCWHAGERSGVGRKRRFLLHSRFKNFRWLWTDQLMTDRAVFGLSSCSRLVVVYVLLLPCGSCLVCVGRMSSHGDSWTEKIFHPVFKSY